MSGTTLVLVLLALSAVLHATAPRQGVVHADREALRWHRRTGGTVDNDALASELTRRLRVGAVGSGIGALLGGAALALGAAAGTSDGPDGLADVALVLSSTVVCAVAAEAVNVWRRTPSPSGPRAASLVPRSAHAHRAERLGELALVALMVAALALAVVTVAQDVRGGRGAVAASFGALVVAGACLLVRARTLRHRLVARDDRELAVVAAAADASTDRFTDNVIASGGVLTLASLLVPALAAGPGDLRTTALLLGGLVVACMVTTVAVRRSARVGALA